MSAPARVEITADTSRFTGPMKKAENDLRALDGIGKSALRNLGLNSGAAFGEIQMGANRSGGAVRGLGTVIQSTAGITRSALQGMSTYATQTASSMTNLGTAGGNAMNNLAAQTRNYTMALQGNAAQVNANLTSNIGLMMSFSSMIISIVALEASLSKYDKALLNIQRKEDALAMAQVGADRATTKLKSAKEKLIKLEAKGLQGSQQYVIALEQQQIAIDDAAVKVQQLTTKTEDLRIANLDFMDTLKLLGSAIFMTVLTTGTSVMMMLGQMATAADMTTSAYVRMQIATIKQKVANSSLIFNLKGARLQFMLMRQSIVATGPAFTGMRASMALTRVSLNTLKFAIKGIYMALGPLGWAMLGIGTAAELIMNNVGGSRDALDDMTGGLVSNVMGLDDVNAAMDDVAGGTVGLDAEINQLTGDLTALNGGLGGTSTGLNQLGHNLLGTSAAMGSTFDEALKSIEEMRKITTEQGSETVGAAMDAMINNIALFADETKYATEDINLAMEAILPTLDSVAEKYDIAWGPGASEKRIKQMLKETNLTKTQVDKITDALTKQVKTQKELNDEKKNSNDLDPHEDAAAWAAEFAGISVTIKKEVENIKRIGGDMINEIEKANRAREMITNKHYSTGGRRRNPINLGGNYGTVISKGDGTYIRTFASGTRNNPARWAHIRRGDAAIALAKSWGWSPRQRSGRGSVKTYFRNLRAGGLWYVAEVRRRAEALGLDPGRYAYDEFDRRAEFHTDRTERTNKFVRGRLLDARESHLYNIGDYVHRDIGEVSDDVAQENRLREEATII